MRRLRSRRRINSRADLTVSFLTEPLQGILGRLFFTGMAGLCVMKRLIGPATFGARRCAQTSSDDPAVATCFSRAFTKRLPGVLVGELLESMLRRFAVAI